MVTEHDGREEDWLVVVHHKVSSSYAEDLNLTNLLPRFDVSGCTGNKACLHTYSQTIKTSSNTKERAVEAKIYWVRIETDLHLLKTRYKDV